MFVAAYGDKFITVTFPWQVMILITIESNNIIIKLEKLLKNLFTSFHTSMYYSHYKNRTNYIPNLVRCVHGVLEDARHLPPKCIKTIASPMM